VHIGSEHRASGEGRSKRDAERAAAHALLDQLGVSL
jgi:dsRNA-specific ribonuclease